MSLPRFRRRILLVGASGQVGNQISSLLPPGSYVPTSRRVANAGWLTLDLASISRHEAEDLIVHERIGNIFCLGGMTDVDGCESSLESAMRANCQGPAILAAAAAKHHAGFVYFSTDYVFNGQDGPYSEEARGDPISAYGRSKWLGEMAVQNAHPAPLIIRTTGVYGPDPNGKNFLYSLHRRLAACNVVRVPEDQVSTPTYNADLAAAVIALVQSEAGGTFHIAGPDFVSRLEFAQRAAAAMGLVPSEIQGIPTSELGQIAARPLRGGLSTTKLSKYLPDVRMRSIEEAISDWNPARDFI